MSGRPSPEGAIAQNGSQPAGLIPGLSFFPDRPDWEIQTLRLVAEAEYGGADIFECLRAAERIRERGLTEPVWREEWSALGNALAGDGLDFSPETGVGPTGVSRAGGALRAMNYLRTAEFFMPYGDSGRLELFTAARSAFRAALPHLPVEIEPIVVPAGDEAYEGYLYRGRGVSAERPAPAVVFLGGADSYAEELYFFGARAIAERGISVITADTPGRGVALRRDGIVTRPDYEVPGGYLLDALAAQPFVDADRLGVVGSSLGGYYAPRVAAADPRVKVLVCSCVCFDVLEDLYRYYPPIQAQMRWIAGAADEAEAVERYSEFNLAEAAPEIGCPVLLTHGAADALMPASSAQRLFDEVGTDDKVLRIWEPDEGGALHCNYDNWARCTPFMFDWLVERLGAQAAA